jgi:hypothetical protein
MDSRGETGNGVGEAAELPQERAVYVARTLGARFLLLGEAVSVRRGCHCRRGWSACAMAALRTAPPSTARRTA